MAPTTALVLICSLCHYIVGSLNCQTSYECSNQTIEADTVSFTGYKSASGANTIIKCTYCDCNGAYSCYNVQNISFTDYLYCSGSHSCSTNVNPQLFITSNAIGTQIWCTGTNSCTSAVISITVPNSEDFIACYGFLACAKSHISGMTKIYAAGAYALYNAHIDSYGIAGDILYLFFYGYNAGYNATIICRSSHRCFIYCPQSGCIVSLQCDGSLCEYFNPNKYVTYAYIERLYHYLKDITLQNEQNCNNNLTSTSFDDSHALSTDLYINNSAIDNICCRGSLSCSSNSSIAIYHTTAQQNVIANAYSAFHMASLDVIDTIFCSGSNSCTFSQINIVTNIYCLGANSCKGIIINQLQNIASCIGTRSCLSSTITTSGDGNVHYINFIGYASGKYATVHCSTTDKCNILCVEHYDSGPLSNSCADTILLCDGICEFEVECTSNDGLCPVIETSQPTASPIIVPSAATLNPVIAPTEYPSITPSLTPFILSTSSDTISNSTSYPFNITSSKPSVYDIYPTYLNVSTSNLTFKASPSTASNHTIYTTFVSQYIDDEDNDHQSKTKNNYMVILYVVAAVMTATCCIICVCGLYYTRFVHKRKAKDDIELASKVQAKDNDDIMVNAIADMEENKVTEKGLPGKYSIDNISSEENQRGEGSTDNKHHDVIDSYNIQADEFVVRGNDEHNNTSQ